MLAWAPLARGERDRARLRCLREPRCAAACRASSGSAPAVVCPGTHRVSPRRRDGASTRSRADRAQGADVAYRVDAPAGMVISRRVHPPHVVRSGSMTDRAGRETSSGQEDLAARPFSTKRPAGARPIKARRPSPGLRPERPISGGRSRASRRPAPTAATNGSASNSSNSTWPKPPAQPSAQRRPLGHGHQLDPRQLAIDLLRRLALRRLQPQRFAERHRHPRIQLGAEPLAVSSVRRPDRATDDQHGAVRQRRASAQTRSVRMPPAWRPAPGRPCTSTTRPSPSASAVRSTHR